MALSLTGRDLLRLRAASETLLSPLDSPSVRDWSGAVLDRVCALFEADRAILVAPDFGRPLVHSDNLPPHILAAYRTMIEAGQGPGAVRFHERPDVDTVFERMRAARLEVWSNRLLEQAAGVSMRETPFYHEVLAPGGVAYGSGLVTPLPLGEAYLCVAHSRPDQDPFGEAAGLDLLGLLLPAFKAGMNLLVRLGTERSRLSRVVDTLPHALALFDASGRRVHENRALADVLAAEPDAELLRRELARVAHGLARLLRRGGAHAAASRSAPPTHTVRTPAAAYTLRGSLLGEGVLGGDPLLLVALERSSGALPTALELRERFGLSRREATIALLLAARRRNTEIAAALSISPHTARHHTEQVLLKLGLHSRTAVHAHLLMTTGHVRSPGAVSRSRHP